jgi:putative ATPase
LWKLLVIFHTRCWQCVAHLAQAKKSVAVYKAMEKVKEIVRTSPAEPVPMHIRNAPTALMKECGYGDNYKVAN